VIKRQFFVFFIIILGLFFRLTYLDADPTTLSWSKGSYTDTGYYLNNARNKLYFNNVVNGDWDNRVLIPVYHYITYFYIKIVGLNFYKINLFSVLISFFSLIILYLFSDKQKYILFLGSLDFLFIIISRTPYVENSAILFCLLSLYFFIKQTKKDIIFSYIFLILGIFTKTTVVFLFPVFFIYNFYALKNKMISSKKMLFNNILLLITFIITSIIFFLLYNNLDNTILKYTLFNKPKINIFNINFILSLFKTNLFSRFFVISFTSIIYLIYILSIPKKLNNKDFIMVLWFLICFFQLSFFVYKPLRYYLYLIYPMLYFSSKYFNDLKKIKLNKFLIVLFSFFISYNLVWVFDRSLFSFNTYYKYFNYIVFFVFLSIIFFLKYSFNKNIKYLFLIIFICFSAFQFYIFHIKKIRYDLKNISIDLSKQIKNDSVLAGWFAPELSINNKLRVLPSYNMDEFYLKKNNCKYIIVATQKNIKKLHFLKKYVIKNIKVDLYLYEIN